ncbi:helix-turn-helix transcriptional regulator [Mucilaginibacter gossypii]|uniref:helix-turn-helix domain-containing protein n=1 Tax=Mucilaginibacter gossypii TaxID=551996 RepID=UPI000DCCA255|nr:MULTISPECIES: helix-turn-helix transcriptional regulator [Mucilaginibacter]QTE36370.1 helix-turn-helix transcriptional regulator [Mucilaginibacter gossypii]RAV55866.1 XRE family transcriptional regulator [Mucilaginibacter rubeus]
MPKTQNEKFSAEEIQLLEQLGKRIKTLRIQKGFSNYEHFAYESGISRTQYGKYETGDNLKFLTLMKVLKTLDIPASEFFAEGFDH